VSDLEQLLCARPATGYEVAARKYRREGDLDCKRPRALAAQAATLGELARGLVAELDMVVEFGCAGACSPAIDRLRATSRRLQESLQLLSTRAEFDPGDPEDPLWPASLGWVARLGRDDAEVELACARHHHEGSDGEPLHNQCRLTVLERGHVLADYYPHWHQQVELPDRGGLHLQGTSRDGPPGEIGNQIVIIGSALATASP
jgi:hypothetical protein